MVVDWVTNTPGTPLTSNVVKIGTEGGLCSNSIESGSDRNFHGQSSIASLEYISPTNKEHGNTLHISVSKTRVNDIFGKEVFTTKNSIFLIFKTIFVSRYI